MQSCYSVGADVYWRWSQTVGGINEHSGGLVMTKSSFIDMDRVTGEMRGKAHKQSMAEVGRRDRELAIEKGSSAHIGLLYAKVKLMSNFCFKATW